MALPNVPQETACLQVPRDELLAVLQQLNDSPLLQRLQEYRPVGRQGYPLRALWYAYIASFILNLPHTNALIRRLQEDHDLRHLCGFGDILPHRTTFNRFIQRLSYHADLVEQCFVQITKRLKELLPDLGDVVAIDSTFIRSHCNPNRNPKSDPEASWTAKNSTQAKGAKKEWKHGYKLHMVADANHGLPLGQIITTAKRNDTQELPVVTEKTRAIYSWFRPSFATADKGYDSQANHDYLLGKGTVPIILRRKHSGHGLYDGIYTEQGVPTCIGKVPMEYIRSDPAKGHLYRCAGCHLKDSKKGMSTHCDTEFWQDPTENLHRFGVIRRDSPAWKALYAKRQAIERIFKSMKESRRLERHCVRGLRQITLHCLMSTLSFQATVIVRLQRGQEMQMRWMIRQVA